MDEHTNNEQTHSDDHMSPGEYLTEHGQFNSRSATNQSTLLKFRRITHTHSHGTRRGIVGQEGFSQRGRAKEKVMG